jgi:hypothetical protein
MAKIKLKDNKNILWIAAVIIVILLFYGGNHGWFKSITNNFNLPTGDDSNVNSQNYYCCASVDKSNSCNLNACPFGSSKVYVDSFNTLSGCTSQCGTSTPNILPAVTNTSLTCQQIAAQANALYYNKNVTSAKECLDFAILDCQDTGKIIDGYAVQGNCCYYTCVTPAPVEPIICHASDSALTTIEQRLQSVGTCHDNNVEITDACANNMLNEYYCEAGFDGVQVCGFTSFNCDAMIQGTICQAGKCVESSSACDAQCDALQGYNSGGCFAYNPNGAVSLAQTCTNNNGEYKSITDVCYGTKVCCCR